MKTVVKEQIYRNITTGEIAQYREEMDDGTVQWERPDGSVWDSHMDDPGAVRLNEPEAEQATTIQD